MPTPLIAAHRGNSQDYPENTLCAFRAAWEAGIPYIELDIHTSADGEPVVIHDADLRRVANRPEHVAGLSAEALAQVDVGSWKAARFAGEGIPTLEAVLEAMPTHTRALIESKVGVSARLREVAARFAPRAELMSFDYAVVCELKKALPQVPVYWVLEHCKHPERILKKAQQAGLDGLNPNQKHLSPAFAAAVKAAGLRLITWTVDKPTRARELAAMGVDILTTNHPNRLAESLGLA